MPQAELFWGGIRPPDLLPGWITSHCLTLLLSNTPLNLQQTSDTSASRPLHQLLCDTCGKTRVYLMNWADELLIIDEYKGYSIKNGNYRHAIYSYIPFAPLLSPRQFNRTNSNISEQGFFFPQILSSVPGAALLDEQHEVWHIFVPVSLIDRSWILLNCAGELAQILLKF